MPFSKPQNDVIRGSLDVIERDIGKEERDALTSILDLNKVNDIDAHYLTGLIFDLKGDHSFQSRIQIIQDIQKEIKRLSYLCCVCKTPCGMGSYCEEHNPSNSPKRLSWDTLKHGFPEQDK